MNVFTIDQYRNGITSRELWMKRNTVSILSSSVLLFHKLFSSFLVTNFNANILSARNCIEEKPASTVELYIQRENFKSMSFKNAKLNAFSVEVKWSNEPVSVDRIINK